MANLGGGGSTGRVPLFPCLVLLCYARHMKPNPYETRCLRCNHTWVKRQLKRPVQCPSCHCYEWDRPAMSRADVARKGAEARWGTAARA